MTATKACERWGSTSGPDTDDPSCYCSMCMARRWDRMSAKEKARNERMRP